MAPYFQVMCHVKMTFLMTIQKCKLPSTSWCLLCCRRRGGGAWATCKLRLEPRHSTRSQDQSLSSTLVDTDVLLRLVGISLAYGCLFAIASVGAGGAYHVGYSGALRLDWLFFNFLQEASLGISCKERKRCYDYYGRYLHAILFWSGGGEELVRRV